MLNNTFELKNTWLILLILVTVSCAKQKPKEFSNYEALQLPKEIIVQQTLFLSDKVGFAVGGKRSDHGYLFKTTDGGESWELKYDVDGYNLYVIHFMDSLNGVLCGESMRYYYTKDGGESWNRQFMWPNLPQMQKDMSDFKKIVEYNDTTLLMVCGDDYNEGVLFRINTDHKNWTFEEKDAELSGLTMYNKTVFVSGFGYVGEYNFATDSVYQKEQHGDFYVAIHAFSETDLIMAGNEGKFYQSKDGGENWKVVERKHRLSAKRWMINDMMFYNSKEGLAVGNYGLILYSSNKGEDWQEFRLPEKEMLYSISVQNEYAYLSGDKGKIIKVKLADLRE